MKRFLLAKTHFLLLFIVLTFASARSYASHILGMDLYYTWVSGNTYKITAILYGDCSPASYSAFSTLSAAAPVICVYRGSTYVTSVTLAIQAPTAGVDITPVCPSEVGHTQCENTSSTIPGIKKFVYSANYTLAAPVTSTCWQFAYFANNGYYSTSSGRSASITNILSPDLTSIELVDTLDNSVYAHNSSAQFSTIPTPFFCLNDPDTYNPGCVDPDGDALDINLIPAMDCSYSSGCQFGVPVTYTGTAWTPPTTPISGPTPLQVTAGTFSFNSSTGQLDFTPNVTQRSTVVYNVREFRSGSYVGSCQREMNFLVLTCTHTNPSGGIDSAAGGTVVDSLHYTICQGAGPFNIYFDPREPGTGNNITVTSSGLPTGATVTVVNNTTPTPHVTFSWSSTGVAPGTYIFYLTYTDNNCPLAGATTQAITITVTPAPTVTYSVVSAATCSAQEAVTITPGGTGSPWTVTVTGSTSQTFTGVTGSFLDSLSPGTDTIHITSAAGSTCNGSALIVIGGSLPITIAVTNPTVCAPANGSFTISGLVAGSSYTVYYTVGGTVYSAVMVASPGGQIIVTGLAPGSYTGVYAVSATTGCASNVLTFVLTNAAVPTPPTLTSNAPICADSLLLLNATDTSTAIVYSWVGPNGFTSTTTNPSITNAQTNASGVYTVTVTKTATGCSSFSTISVTVKPTPTVPVVSGNSPCAGSSLNLTASSTAGCVYNWSGPASFVSSLQNPTINPASVTNAGTYTVVATLNGCRSLPGTGTYTVYPIPPAPVTVDTSYCQGTHTIPLNATGINLLWYTDTTGTGSTVTPIPSDTATGNYTWYVSQTVNGCESPKKPENVSILYLPVFSISGNTNLCTGATTTLSYAGTTSVPLDYSWSIPSNATLITGTNASSSISIQFNSSQAQYITLTVSDYGGKCVTTETVPITVVDPPLSQFYIKPNICIYDTVLVALSYRSPSASFFVWNFAGADTIAANSNSGGPYSLSWHDTGIHIISLVTSTDIGCTSPPVFDTVDVHGLPDAAINAPVLAPACIEDTVILSARSDQYNDTYTWMPAHFFNRGLLNKSNNNSTVSAIVDYPGYVKLTVTDPFGCSATDSLRLNPKPCCEVLFPNAFTPNGDTHNDVFRPIFKGYHNFHVFRIVNRWGQTVFETSNSNGAWDGNYNGVPQDMGVYYYYLKYDCGGGTQEAKGDVTLVR